MRIVIVCLVFWIPSIAFGATAEASAASAESSRFDLHPAWKRVGEPARDSDGKQTPGLYRFNGSSELPDAVAVDSILSSIASLSKNRRAQLSFVAAGLELSFDQLEVAESFADFATSFYENSIYADRRASFEAICASASRGAMPRRSAVAAELRDNEALTRRAQNFLQDLQEELKPGFHKWIRGIKHNIHHIGVDTVEWIDSGRQSAVSLLDDRCTSELAWLTERGYQ